MNLAFPVRLTPEDDGTIMVQGCEPFTGVLTFGDDRAHALAMAREALTGVLEAMLDAGEAIPRPTQVEGPDIAYVTPEPTLVAPILLKWAREEARISQVELAERIGVSQQAYQKLERARSNPSIKTLARVARALGRELQLGI
jgi:DNA-binding XRE family transcriptional regulator/predicted RNase H-like HicB family nuclease